VKVVIHIPTAPYAYAGVEVDADTKAEMIEKLKDVDSELSDAIRDAYIQASAIGLIKGGLGASEVVESDAPKKPWERKQAAPKAAVPSSSDFFGS